MPIVSAVLVMSGTLNPTEANKARCKRIEAAMVKAVEDAMADGLCIDKDAGEVRARMMAAREAAKAE